MSRRAWLTPDDPPGDLVCRRVFVPSGRDYLAAFRGAFLLLTDTENWEQVGTQTPEDVSQAFLDALFASIEAGEASCVGHLIGEIFLFAGDTAPLGTLACDGSIILIADYPALYEAIGVAFGGDGIDDFALPDLRGRVPIGTGQGSGLTNRVLADQGGNEGVELQVSNMPDLTHTHHLGIEGVAVASGTSYTVLRTGTPVQFVQPTDAINPGDGQNPQPVPIVQPFTALNFFIQAE